MRALRGADPEDTPSRLADTLPRGSLVRGLRTHSGREVRTVRLSEWRAEAPAREAVTATVLGVARPVLAALGCEA